MNINSTKLKAISWIFLGASFFLVYIALISVVSNFTNAASQGQQKGLSDSELNKFSQNNILFYNPGECIEGSKGGSGTICGNTAREKYWSALGKYFDDPIKKAGIMGSISKEGQFSPTSWQCGNGMDSGGNFVVSWDTMFDLSYSNPTYIGVGGFGITSGLSTYLHWINDNSPTSTQYLKDPVKYAYNWCRHDSEHETPGDQTLEVIGESAFDELIEWEVKYAMEEFKTYREGVMDEYKSTNFATPSDAASFWAKEWERGEDYLNPSTDRLAAAEKAYDDFKDFKCTANSGSSDITLIGDSMSVYSEKELQSKFPNSFFTMVGSRSISNGGFCAGDKGGLSILEEIVSGSGTIKIQHQNSNSCDDLTINSDSLKNNIVWELGTNTGGANKDNIDKVVKLAGNKNLFLVTPYNNNSNLKKTTEDIAELYRDTAKKNDNVYVVDWAKAVDGKASKYLDSSGYHPNSEGKKLLANLISNAVSNSGNSSGSSSNSGNSSSSSNSGDPNDSSSVSGSDITWIGDSDSALAHDEKGYELVQRTFPGVDYGSSFNEDGSYIQSGKFISQNVGGNKSGLDILKEIIQENKLRPYLVFALGGNGGWTDPEMKEFLNLIDGKDVKVIITTTKYRTVDFVEGNEIARKTAEEHPNIYLADVADNYKDEYIDDTGIEFNAEGGKMFVKTIKETLEKASGGGCTTYEGEYPQYNQCGDSRWSGIKYSTKPDGTPDDICGSGCGAASMAMLATVATGQDIFPNDIADLLGTQYYDKVSIHTLDPIVGEHYGFEVINESASSVEEAKTKLRDYLKKGYMIHFTGQGCYPGFILASGKCTGGHVIGLFDIDSNDMVTQANSGMGEVHQKASLDDMAHAMMESWGIFTAIKGKNSGKNTCNTVDNVCGDSKTSNTSTNASNLTEEQSQKLADYYNSTDGTYNCTTFVMWFVQNFTDLEYGGGNGGDVAHNLAVANNLEEGNEPRPLSVFSVTSIGSETCGNSKCGHTGVIASVDGNTLSTVEAAWKHYGGTVFTNVDKSNFSNSKYGKTYVYLDGHIDMDKLKKVIGS